MNRLIFTFLISIFFTSFASAQDYGSKHYKSLQLDVPLAVLSGGIGNTIGDASSLSLGGTPFDKLRIGWSKTPSEFGAIGLGHDAAAINAAIAAINAAIAAISAAGGGRLIIPNNGVAWALEAPVILKTNVVVECVGYPILKLNAGVNDTVFEGESFKTWIGTSGTQGISNFGVKGCILDGNVSSNTVRTNGGHGLAFVGHDFLIADVKVQNVAGSCFWGEYAAGGGGASPYAGRYSHLLGNTCGQHGFYRTAPEYPAHSDASCALGRG